MTQNRQLGSCSAVDDSQARLMEILGLTSNPFYREFDKIALIDAVKKLPGMQGSGAVRDLQEAASLNTQASAKLLANCF